MPIQRKDIALISKALESMTLMDVPGAANQTLSNRQAIRELAPTLRKKKKEGFSTDALVAILKSKNIIIEGPTLNRYLNELQTDKAGNKKTRAKPSPAVPADVAQNEAAPVPAPETQTTDEPDSDADVEFQDEESETLDD